MKGVWRGERHEVVRMIASAHKQGTDQRRWPCYYTDIDRIRDTYRVVQIRAGSPTFLTPHLVPQRLMGLTPESRCFDYRV